MPSRPAGTTPGRRRSRAAALPCRSPARSTRPESTVAVRAALSAARSSAPLCRALIELQSRVGRAHVVWQYFGGWSVHHLVSDEETHAGARAGLRQPERAEQLQVTSAIK